MASTTVLYSSYDTSAGNKSGAGTPTAGAYIVVVASTTGASTTAISDTQSGTYSQIEARSGFSTAGNLTVWVRTTPIPSAVSTTFTATQTSSTGGGLTVLNISGITLQGVAAVRSYGGQSTGTAGTIPAPVLIATPLGNSTIITAVSNGTNTTSTATPRTGYNLDTNIGYNTPATSTMVTHRDGGETSQTLTYGGTSASAFASTAIELVESRTLYWVGGTGNWNDTSHWSTSTGGAGGAAIPSRYDNAIFDANSFTATGQSVTVNVPSDVADVNFTGVLNNPSLVYSDRLSIYGSYTLVSGMTTSGSQQINFVATTTGKTITTGGKTLPTLYFNGSGGGWILQDNMTVSGGINLQTGTLDINGKTVNINNFNSNGSLARSLVMNAGTINLSNTSTAWDISTSTNMTLSAAGSTLNFTGGGEGFHGGGFTYGTVTFNLNAFNFARITGNNTFANLTITGGVSKTAGYSFSGTQTVTGTFTVNGNSATNRLLVASSVIGTTATINAAAVSLSNVDFRDITGAGTAAPFTGTSLGNALGNSGITFTAPVTRYWVAFSGGSWSSTASWSATSGGASGASVPLAQDTVVVDGNSITSASRTITADMPRMGANISFTGVLNNPTLNGTVSLDIFGNLTFVSGMTFTSTGYNTVYGRGSHTINTAGIDMGGYGFTVASPGGTYTLASNFSSTYSNFRFSLDSGTLTANNYNVTVAEFIAGATPANPARALNMGSGTWTITGATTGFNINSTTTLNSGTSTIVYNNTGTSQKPFVGRGYTYYNLVVNTDNLVISFSNTFNNLTLNTAGKTTGTAITSSTTQTITGSMFSNGTAGNLAKLISTTAGSPATLTKASGSIILDYMSIKDSTATGGATWYAGANSTNVSGNTGWLFSSPILGSATLDGNSSMTAVGTINFTGTTTIVTSSDMSVTATATYKATPNTLVGESNIASITANATLSAQIQTFVGQSAMTVSGATSISSSTLNQTLDNDEVVSYEPGVNGGGALMRAGQQFTVPTGQTSISQIRLKVRLYDPGASASVVLKGFASGSATTGTPLATSNATTVSSLTNADHMFTFSPAWSVTPGTSLFFGVYSSTEMIAVRYQNTDVYAGGNRWHASYGGAGGTTAFQSDIGDLNFSLYSLVPGSTGASLINTGSEMTVSGTAKFFANSTITTGSNFTAVGSRQVSASASIVTGSNVTAVAVIGHIVNVNSDGNSNMTVSGAKNYYGIADPIGQSDILVYGSKVHYGLASPQGNSSISILDVGIAITHLNISKSYIYKIYDKNWNYLGIWNDVVSEFGYSQEINSAGSSITVTLARNSDSLVANYASLSDDSGNTLTTDSNDELAAETSTLNAIGPGTTVDLNLNVKIYEFSSGPQAVEGDLVFTGYISMYSSKYGTTENTNVSLFSYGADLDNWLLVDSANNTRVPYLSKDPSVILKDTLDKFVTAGGLITYDTNSIANTNTLVSYAFNTNTELEAIKKCLELAPTDWYFYTDLATNLLYFKPRPTLVSHYFYLGRHIFSLDLDKSLEGIVNDVVFTGGKPENLVSDTFTMPTGQSLVAHAPETGSTWVQHGTTVANQSFVASSSGRIYKVGGGEAFFYNNVPMPTTDFDITANIYVASAANEMGVLGGLDANGDNGILAQISGTGLSIYSRTAGTWTQLGTTVAVSPTVGATYKMQLKREGQNIKLYWNNAAAIEVTSTASTASGVNVYTGIRASLASTATTGYHMDSFRAKLVDESLGTPVFKRYTNAASISAYRRGLSRISDGRVSVPSSADIIATTEINRQKEPRYRSKITIANGTYDIRSIKLGQLVGFRNFGNFVDDITMQVVRIDYTPDAVILQLDTLVPSVPKRLEDIKRNLNQVEVEDNPDAPDVVAL